MRLRDDSHVSDMGTALVYDDRVQVDFSDVATSGDELGYFDDQRNELAGVVSSATAMSGQELSGDRGFDRGPGAPLSAGSEQDFRVSDRLD